MFTHRPLMPLTIVATAVIFVATLSSCADPPANTSGYRVFTGTTEGFHISFEYPKTWHRQDLETHGAARSVFLYSIDEPTTSISIFSDLPDVNTEYFANASQYIQHILNRDAQLPDFEILSHSQVLLGQAEWEETTYSFRFSGGAHTTVDKLVVNSDLATDWEGRIYSIGLFVDADKYESFEEDFEHLVATFQFLE